MRSDVLSVVPRGKLRRTGMNRDESCAGGGWEPLEDAEFGVGHVRMLRFFEDHFQTLVAWGKEEG